MMTDGTTTPRVTFSLRSGDMPGSQTPAPAPRERTPVNGWCGSLRNYGSVSAFTGALPGGTLDVAG